MHRQVRKMMPVNEVSGYRKFEMCIRDRSYDFTGLTDDELEKQLAVVDDRRIWVIAEALRRGAKYEHIHEITKIDLWAIFCHY